MTELLVAAHSLILTRSIAPSILVRVMYLALARTVPGTVPVYTRYSVRNTVYWCSTLLVTRARTVLVLVIPTGTVPPYQYRYRYLVPGTLISSCAHTLRLGVLPSGSGSTAGGDSVNAAGPPSPRSKSSKHATLDRVHGAGDDADGAHAVVGIYQLDIHGAPTWHDNRHLLLQ